MSGKKKERLSKKVHNSLLMIIIFAVASCIGYIFRHVDFPDTNTVVVYLLAVLITTRLTSSFILGLMASVLATFSFNYFFAEPQFTFSVNDPNYIITFITMTITALVTSTLTSHDKRSALAAQEKEAEARAIYNLTNHLTDSNDIHNMSEIAVFAISECFSCEAACLCFDEHGNPEPSFVQQVKDKQIRRETLDIQNIKYRITGLRTAFDVGEEFCDFPIYGRENILGVIRIPKEKAQAMNEIQKRLLHAMIESTALAMDRFRSSEQRIKSREETMKERYRANLLRSISHDLRTPLTSIIGTSEMLMDMTEKADLRYSMAGSIQKDAYWLHSLVENILNLTRLEDGQLSLERQPEAVEEVIGEAVSHVLKRSPDYEIAVSVPEELLIVPMDAKLIEQVIINLLDNAIKHTEPGDEISISVKLNEQTDFVEFTVSDRGTGIREGDLQHIFQMFYTTHSKYSDAAHGIGLGLAICETIIKAHDGSITAHNRTDGAGAEFIFTLPAMRKDCGNV